MRKRSKSNSFFIRIKTRTETRPLTPRRAVALQGARASTGQLECEKCYRTLLKNPEDNSATLILAILAICRKPFRASVTDRRDRRHALERIKPVRKTGAR